jgi:putative inorganic carbon (hco3(-)) transporter
VSEALELVGCLGAAAAVSGALLTSDSRLRAAALLVAMGMATALVAGQGWDELANLRDHHLQFAGAIVGAIVVVGLGAAAMVRWPILLPLLVVATLPFRIRLHVAGGQDVNLLIPLYAVIGAGVLASAVETLRGRARMRPLPQPLVFALVLVICLYALQATYSADLDFAARNIGFFLTPFAVLFCLLAMVDWSRRTLALAFGVLLLEAVIFAGIGIGQYATEHIFWNGKLEASNDFHFYFRVNSLFWDPNIYGRYLMVAILFAGAALLWTSDRRLAFGLVGTLAVIFAGLVFSFSQTTFISLFVGLAVLAGLRWSAGWVAVGAPLAFGATILALLFLAGGSNESSHEISEGHSSLISGGAKLAEDRPLYGYGSASFSKEFARAENVPAGETTISHTEPITVAAEQGVIGIVGYAALLAAALWTVLSGTGGIAPGLGGRLRSLEDGDRAELAPARVGLAAAFVALLAHTVGYAAYLTDPLTWALLALGGVLAAEMGAAGWPGRVRHGSGDGESTPAPSIIGGSSASRPVPP